MHKLWNLEAELCAIISNLLSCGRGRRNRSYILLTQLPGSDGFGLTTGLVDDGLPVDDVEGFECVGDIGVVGFTEVGLPGGLVGLVRSGGIIAAGTSSIVVQVTRAGCDGVEEVLDEVIQGRVLNVVDDDVDEGQGFGGFSGISLLSMLLLNFTVCSMLTFAVVLLK